MIGNGLRGIMPESDHNLWPGSESEEGSGTGLLLITVTYLTLN